MTELFGRQGGTTEPPKEPLKMDPKTTLTSTSVLTWATGSSFCLPSYLSPSLSCLVRGIIYSGVMTERKTTGDTNNANAVFVISWSSYVCSNFPGDLWQLGPLGSFYYKLVLLLLYVASFMCLMDIYPFPTLYLVDYLLIPVDNVIKCKHELVVMFVMKKMRWEGVCRYTHHWVLGHP